ncbi:hypothetical protein [Nocardia transvalensis]|uniref:hypothetical protein n=1 Tax=Nocardia transvalensis TaxID=37333 RepID=UPI001895ED2D|nr:hypothetical protein [Nocardia transvalensis]MBF6333676.1 hypothetical protein [Nocardia transvalensis]
MQAYDADDLAEKVYRYARPHLRSRDIDVAVNLEELRGSILAGVRNGGSFANERVADPSAQT